jgi:uncharacterized protein YjiS (DUF1127 family)
MIMKVTACPRRAVFAELDDRLLDDIGVTREEAIRESRNRS